MLFILSSISSGLEFWSVNHIWLCKNSESDVFKNVKFSVTNWPNDLLEQMYTILLSFVDNYY